MPDYTTTKLNEKVMGPRLFKILKKFQEISSQNTCNNRISLIHANQIEGLDYCTVKRIRLNRIVKKGNEITIIYDTKLATNYKNMEGSQLRICFVEGVTEYKVVNEFSTMICYYLND